MDFHKYANLFPLIPGADFDRLREINKQREEDKLMTWDRDFGFECDGENCSATVYEPDYESNDDRADFHESKDEMDSLGWITRKIDDEWRHFCSKECLKSFL